MTASYVLSKEADNDIEDIFEYGELKFGASQAIEYLIGMNSHFEVIAKNPNIGIERKEIRNELFSFPYKSHVIFYRKMRGYVRIIRVLYGGRDLIKILT
ncbi:type II toxin-antitoxin system RelE/ParE family toxin [Muricauda ruestringensis]|uniref:Toxin n=1 Tax=Flagellimonas aurea TaxID=2915619 RepID=A0ABS3G6T7_9FLAO|nr:type II toxin-antitoxin system RelE/ParE family toxin [Allomuricauda aurea]MAO17447.1 plasmid stabilization protein [Allomuricauda sp.]MBC73117.1 plasmid stabilization protein [Allomuricauda sp.]MBO0354988.1 type II toxin-antitoxin system RelE/ParE family toxin [Allomuricauda aurea]|tara:strand:- start:2727 stop:3023 length:297 start_codon:yes stop_codon:yes gene_type:complete